MYNRIIRFLSCLTAACAAAQAQTDIGPIDIQGGRGVLAVTIETGIPGADALLQNAFAAHGDFKPVAPGGSALVLRFIPAGENQVQVEVVNGASTVLSTACAGNSGRDALLRAADAAVQALTHRRGWFAGRLAFVGRRAGGSTEIYTSDIFLGEMLQQTGQRASVLSPRWSPDGSRLLFTSYYRAGFPDIYLYNLRSRELTPLASFKGTNQCGRFSPDGSHIAMVLSGEGNPEVYVSNAHGRGVRRLTVTDSVESSPCWSPDGSRLVFTSDRAGNAQLYTMPATGGSMTRLPTNISGYCAEPDWSAADPDKIAFTAASGRTFQVAVYSFSTGESRIVSHEQNDAIEPVWLSDGRHLIYTARSANTRRLMILDTETGRTTPLTPQGWGNMSQADVL